MLFHLCTKNLKHPESALSVRILSSCAVPVTCHCEIIAALNKDDIERKH